MASSYNGQAIFQHGPHRFRPVSHELYVVQLWRTQGVEFAGTNPTGESDTDIVVTGRVVAQNESQLDTRVQALTSLVALENFDLPTQETLVDGHGRVYEDASLISVELGERVDRGRSVSVSYVATFRIFKQLLF